MRTSFFKNFCLSNQSEDDREKRLFRIIRKAFQKKNKRKILYFQHFIMILRERNIVISPSQQRLDQSRRNFACDLASTLG